MIFFSLSDERFANRVPTYARHFNKGENYYVCDVNNISIWGLAAFDSGTEDESSYKSYFLCCLDNIQKKLTGQSIAVQIPDVDNAYLEKHISQDLASVLFCEGEKYMCSGMTCYICTEKSEKVHMLVDAIDKCVRTFWSLGLYRQIYCENPIFRNGKFIRQVSVCWTVISDICMYV